MPDERFRNDWYWPFYWFDTIEKARIHAAQNVIVKEADATISGKPLTAATALESRHFDQSANEIDEMKSGFLPSSICGGKTYWRKRYLDLMHMVKKLGTPHLFVTLTANEFDWPEILEACDGDHHSLHAAEVTRLFFNRFHRLMQQIRSGQPFGKVSDFWYRVEYQQRGSPHIHLILWLNDTSNLCQHVCSTLPVRPPNLNDEQQQAFDHLEKLVKKHQIHDHKQYCIPQPEGVLSEDEPACCSQGFPEPPVDKCFVNLHGKAVYTRGSTDGFVIPYNPKLLQMWAGNVNTQVCTGDMIVRYLVKYLVKTEPVLHATLQPNNNPFLKTDYGQHVYARCVGSPECCARLMGVSHARGSRKCFFIDTNPPGTRTRALLPKSALEDLPAESTDVFWQSRTDHYLDRPDSLEHLNIVEYFSRYSVWTKSQGRPKLAEYELDYADRAIVTRRKEAVVRWHFKTPFDDGDAFYFQQLMLRTPFRSYDELLSSDNLSGTYREECYRRGIIIQRNEEDFLRTLALERNFSPSKIETLLENMRNHHETRNSTFDGANPPPPPEDDFAWTQSDSDHPPPGEFPTSTQDFEDIQDVLKLLGLPALLNRNKLKYSDALSVAELTPSQRFGNIHSFSAFLSFTSLVSFDRSLFDCEEDRYRQTTRVLLHYGTRWNRQI